MPYRSGHDYADCVPLKSSKPDPKRTSCLQYLCLRFSLSSKLDLSGFTTLRKTKPISTFFDSCANRTSVYLFESCAISGRLRYYEWGELRKRQHQYYTIAKHHFKLDIKNRKLLKQESICHSIPILK